MRVDLIYVDVTDVFLRLIGDARLGVQGRGGLGSLLI